MKMQFSTFLLIDIVRLLSPASFFLVTLSNRSRNRFIFHLGKSLGPHRNLKVLSILDIPCSHKGIMLLVFTEGGQCCLC